MQPTNIHTYTGPLYFFSFSSSSGYPWSSRTAPPSFNANYTLIYILVFVCLRVKERERERERGKYLLLELQFPDLLSAGARPGQRKSCRMSFNFFFEKKRPGERIRALLLLEATSKAKRLHLGAIERRRERLNHRATPTRYTQLIEEKRLPPRPQSRGMRVEPGTAIGLALPYRACVIPYLTRASRREKISALPLLD